jgi:hypothetical protein
MTTLVRNRYYCSPVLAPMTTNRCQVAEGQTARAERSERSTAHAPPTVGSAAIWLGGVDVGCEPRGIRWTNGAEERHGRRAAG